MRAGEAPQRGGGVLATWWALFWGFFQVGVLGYGGGPGSVGLIQAQAVSGYHWTTSEGFAQMLAIAYALPGPIATKLAGILGYRVGGPVGLAAALGGVVLPSLAAMVGLFELLVHARGNPYVAGLIRGVGPVVIALLVILVLNLIPQSLPSWKPVLFGLVALVLIRGLGWPAPIVVLLAMAGGALFLRP